MNIPEQTLYELESLRRIMDGEGNYPTIEASEEVINRLRYSISEFLITSLLSKIQKKVHSIGNNK